MPALVFEFEGEQVTAKALAARLPAYGERWLLEALKAGCKTRAELVQRETRNEAAKREGGMRGKRTYIAQSETGGRFLVGRLRKA